MRKRSLTGTALLLAAFLVFSTGTAVIADEGAVYRGGIVITNSENFSDGIFEGTRLNGIAVELAPDASGTYTSGGTYISAEIHTDAFNRLVLSWNTDTPPQTSVKIEAQVYVGDVWSSWLYVASWSTWGDKGSASPDDFASDELAFVDTDIVTVNGGKTASAFRYKLSLITQDKNATPSVRLVAGTIRGEAGYEPSIPEDVKKELEGFTGTLDVKPYSQTIRDPQFSNIICSPVSSAMVLDYKGVEILPEMAAMGVLDTYYDGYGNWPFNAAFIGSYGYESYIEYCSGIEDIKYELSLGNPVICSVRYKMSDKLEAFLPIISNAPINQTYGHLIVVVGYEKGEDGKYYVVVNDPAASNDEGVRRNYLEEEFLAAWEPSGRIAYKTHEKVENAGLFGPVAQNAELKATGDTKTVGGIESREYELFTEGSGVISCGWNKLKGKSTAETGVSVVVWDEEAGAVHSYLRPSSKPEIWLTDEQASKVIYVYKKTGEYYKVAPMIAND